MLKGDWEEKCRLATNEAGEPLKTGSTRSLRSRYSWVEPDQLTWTVSAFSDETCSKPRGANRYRFKCADGQDCTQIAREKRSGVVSGWKKQKMVDHAGAPNVLKMKVKTDLLTPKHLRLTTTSEETGAPRTVDLFR